jgi:uncharacterized DUF497 family protein
MQRIAGFIWDDWVLDRLDWKHGVDPQEVEEAFFNPPYKVRTGEGKYLLYARSNGGRYLFIAFVWEGQFVKVITARGMTTAEKRFYGRK